jgi:hypothetical protein
VLFDVYIYLDDPVDSLSGGPLTGELVLKKTGRDNGITANLYTPGTRTPLLQPMRHARLVAMNSGSFVIEGTRTVAQRESSKSKTHSFQVQWIIKHVGAPAVVDAKRLQRRSAGRLAKVLASGFDPADDDRAD